MRESYLFTRLGLNCSFHMVQFYDAFMRCPILLLEGHCHAEFSSNPNKTHINQSNQGLIIIFYIYLKNILAILCFIMAGNGG